MKDVDGKALSMIGRSARRHDDSRRRDDGDWQACVDRRCKEDEKGIAGQRSGAADVTRQRAGVYGLLQSASDSAGLKLGSQGLATLATSTRPACSTLAACLHALAPLLSPAPSAARRALYVQVDSTHADCLPSAHPYPPPRESSAPTTGRHESHTTAFPAAGSTLR